MSNQIFHHSILEGSRMSRVSFQKPLCSAPCNQQCKCWWQASIVCQLPCTDLMHHQHNVVISHLTRSPSCHIRAVSAGRTYHECSKCQNAWRSCSKIHVLCHPFLNAFVLSDKIFPFSCFRFLYHLFHNNLSHSVSPSILHHLKQSHFMDCLLGCDDLLHFICLSNWLVVLDAINRCSKFRTQHFLHLLHWLRTIFLYSCLAMIKLCGISLNCIHQDVSKQHRTYLMQTTMCYLTFSQTPLQQTQIPVEWRMWQGYMWCCCCRWQFVRILPIQMFAPIRTPFISCGHAMGCLTNVHRSSPDLASVSKLETA